MSGNIDMTAKKGYTLIEILIVVALFSIILSIAVPKMGFYRILLEKQEISELKKDLLYARNMAIVDNKSYTVYFKQEDNSYYIKAKNSDSIVKNKTLSSGLKFDNKDLVGSFIFNPTGAAGNSDTLIIKTSTNKKYEIKLSPVTSRIEIKER